MFRTRKFHFRPLRKLGGTLCAALLLATAWPTLAEDTQPVTAIFLVAQAMEPESPFADSIVLTMNNLGPAPVGIIINRPTPISVAEIFPDVKRLERVHDKVYFGGPVELGTVWFLFRASAAPKHAIRAIDNVYLSGDRDLLRGLLRRDKPMDGLRIYIGHAGWGPGQLEGEIDVGAWALKRADADAIFNGEDENPWTPSPVPRRRT
jgi:putative transcriptional regulator